MGFRRKFKNSLCIITAFAIFLMPVSAFASILGSVKIKGYSTEIAHGTKYTHNVFYSDQNGVGQQTENYIEYSPNSVVVPGITYGDALFGGSVLSGEANRLESMGLDIIAGSNADYFSTQTGVPMSNAIVDGKILTKDASGQDAIGILPDGTAFISYFTINSVLKKADGSEVNIYNINKYRQPYAIYLMTDEFSSETQNTTEGIDVILGSIEGEMKIGEKITAVVESVETVTGSGKIPKGKMVLTVDAKAPKEFLEPISTLTPGEEITISFSVSGDSRWSDVQLGMGSVGGRLLINGEVNTNLPTGAAPRTAIGVKGNGTILLYTIDGRQNGHSYGVQLTTLAKRMKELGCVDALNLDGGGSTEMLVQLPGNQKTEIVNKPSDGRERKVSTFFFFTNTAKKTGTPEHLHFYPKMNYVLTGASLQLSLKATDSAFSPASLPKNIEFSVQEGKVSTISQSGLFTSKENGMVTVYANADGITASVPITCLETPTDITITNETTGETVKVLSLSDNEKIDLKATAYGGYNKLSATDENFVWEADPSIGTISKTGQFISSDRLGASGKITITAGEKTVSVPVSIGSPSPNDPKAYPNIDVSLTDGEIKGKISCGYTIDTPKENIIFKIDGKSHDFSYDSASGEFSTNVTDNAKKLTIYATNIFGYTAFKSLIINAEGEQDAPFADTKGHWAEDVLGYMYSQKIISGDPTDGTLKFNPQKPMTRSEFAVMTANYIGIDPEEFKSVNLPYTDLDTIPKWALDSFKALYAKGILKGRFVTDTESYADPLATITRAEAATIVARTLSTGFFKATIDAPDSDDIPQWASDGISTLISIGAMKGYEDKTLKPNNTLTKAEAAKILYSIY